MERHAEQPDWTDTDWILDFVKTEQYKLQRKGDKVGMRTIPFNAFAPVIKESLMNRDFKKHHQALVNNLNNNLEIGQIII